MDELRYLNSLTLFQEGNYKSLFSEGCSIPFLILNILLEKITSNNLIAVKLSSFISAFFIFSTATILLFKLYKIRKIFAILCLIYILNLFAIRPDLFFGINEYTRDVFGYLILLIVLIEPRLNKIHWVLIGFFFGMAILTRQMALSYLLVFIFSGYLINAIVKKSIVKLEYEKIKKNFFILVACGATIILFNSYNLLKFGLFSWENKELYGEINWAQYDYFNAIKNYNGELPRGKHSSIMEVKEYLDKNGKDSLPKSFFEMIYFDWKLTFYEFVIDYFTSLKYLLRLTGLLYFFGVGYLIKKIKKKDFTRKNLLFIIAYSVVFPLAISFVVISNIQPRWFMFFLPLTLCSYFIIINNSQNSKKLVFLTINNLILMIANIPFIYKNYDILL